MKNYAITIEYDGTRYNGWQKNKNADQTIQGKLEAVLAKMAGHEVEIHGSGRTDAGVHARGQVANFQIDEHFKKKEILDYLNQYLPEDIAVTSISKRSERFHARLSATKKAYCYRIHTSRIPEVFERKYVYDMPQEFDVAEMKKAAQHLLGEHDFKAFCGNRKMKKSTVRTIHELVIEETDRELQITITGNGFLQNMVRILVGTLVEIGLGKRKAEEIPAILESKDRQNAGVTMPACGLTLMKVWYEE